MDLYGQIDAINNSPEQLRARQLRRARRRQEIYDHIQGAIGETSTTTVEAALQWSLQSHDPQDDAGVAIGSRHPGVAAVVAARGALMEFDLPGSLDLRFIGMQRFSGRGAHHVDDGIITVEATLHSLSGIDRVVDLPIVVHGGRVLEPACLVDRGVVRALTQSTFDDLIGQGTFKAAVPTRTNMFSPPPAERRPVRYAPLVRPGLFGLAPTNRGLTAAYVRSAMSGYYHEALPDIQAMMELASDHIDRGEMPPPAIVAGDEVTLRAAADVVGRDGQRWHLTSGTKGQVQRDMAGDGRCYYVYFPEEGFSAVMKADQLR